MSSPDTAEHLADLLYEIGKHALVRNNHKIAVKWLERAFGMLEEQNLGMLGPEASELRLCMIQSLGQSSVKPRNMTTNIFHSPGAYKA
jgi:Meiosis protein SPO22/ZIP4 like